MITNELEAMRERVAELEQRERARELDARLGGVIPAAVARCGCARNVHRVGSRVFVEVCEVCAGALSLVRVANGDASRDCVGV